MASIFANHRRDLLLAMVFAAVSALLLALPTGFEERVEKNAVRCRGRVVATEDADIQQFGMVKQGEQGVSLEILDGPFRGKILEGFNPLLGQMDRDTIFQEGDIALVVISLDGEGNIRYVNPQSHYRLGTQFFLLGLFALLLLVFGGWTGLKALLSFLFSALTLWKVLVPMLLKGFDPVWLSLGVVATMTAVIVFLVAGPTRKGLVAFLGAFLGVLTSCLLAVHFTAKLHVHGAVLPFAETLLYSGFGHLDLSRIFVAAVFLAASGAVMDLAMDVSASMDEVVAKKPDITPMEAVRSGITVGRAVVGTMTTTLLLAYSGSYITLLMAFMAQGVPLANLFNLIYVAAEVLKTLVGSFGLVMVAPFTALAGGLIFTRKPARKETPAATVGEAREISGG
ncbi:MAG: YibE/F family protein [Desulfococcaceae bacterium]